MFVTANQFYVFLACVGFGGVSGVLFTLSLPFKLLLKQKWVEWIIDFIIFFIIGLLFILYSLRLKFPSLSTYMIFAVFVGIKMISCINAYYLSCIGHDTRPAGAFFCSEKITVSQFLFLYIITRVRVGQDIALSVKNGNDGNFTVYFFGGMFKKQYRRKGRTDYFSIYSTGRRVLSQKSIKKILGNYLRLIIR